MSVLVVAGTRPEMIKLGPVVRDLRAAVPATYLLTGQHTDVAMSRDAWSACASWSEPDDVLEWDRSGPPSIHSLLAWQNGRPTPGAVVVQGDTHSALVGARFAKHVGATLVHVEAGLRCFDDNVVEERIRVEIDRVADVLLASSRLSYAFAMRDRQPDSIIAMTGQTGLQALREAGVPTPSVARPEWGKWGLVTLHRAELTHETADAIARTAATALRERGLVPVLPAHPRWDRSTFDMLASCGALVTDPMPYKTLAQMLVSTIARPEIIVTDSGGLVEEAYSLGIPSVIVRDTTERWEVLSRGAGMLARDGAGEVEHAIAAMSLPCAWNPTDYDNPYGVPPSHTIVSLVAPLA